MIPEELTIAEASIERLYLPWTYFEEEDQIGRKTLLSGAFSGGC